MSNPELTEFRQKLADSRAFGANQEEIILGLVEDLYALREELRQLKAQPLALDWLTPEQAEQLINRSAPTIRKLARAGAFAVGENPGYKKGKRKMEYYLPGLRKWLFNQNLKPEVIDQRVQAIGRS